MSIDAKPDTDLGTPEPPRPGARHRRPRGRRPLALLLALVFFFGPAAAFVLGQRPQEIENRRLQPLPSVSDGWAFFPNFATWATDHLPLRKQAVEGNAALSERVFGEPPSYGSDTGGVAGVPGTAAGPDGTKEATPKVKYPVVVQGKNDWLYLGSDVSSTCEPSRTVADTLTRASRLATAVERSGRKFVLMVAPDKTTIWPRDLPDNYLGKGCSEARKAEFWAALRATPPPGTVDLRSLLEAKQRADDAPIYRQTDTHWGEAGSVVYTRALADAVQPGLWPTVKVEPTGTVTRVGDLGRLVGRPRSDTYPGFRLLRPGVQARYDSVPEMPRTAPVTLRNTSTNPASPLVSAPVLLLGDSYSNSARNIFPGLFSSLTLLHNEAVADVPDVAAAAVAASDVVVLEIVERSIASGKTALLQDPALVAIEKALAANPR